jgi:hypothetical protein
VNRSLFVSIHAVIGLAIAGVFVWWLATQGYGTGRGGGSDRTFLLWSGWVSLLLYVVVFLYSLRKYAHKLGISPEFKMKLPVYKVERTEKKLNDLRRQIMTGVVTDKRDILERGNRILEEEGAQKILRVQVVRGSHGEPVLEHVPTDPLGRVARWLHAHFYYGVAAAVIVWLHGGGNFDIVASPMSFLLNFTSYLVIVTGLIGIFLWAFGPGLMTRRERDFSIEEAFAIETSLQRKIKAALEGEDPTVRAVFEDVMRSGASFAERAQAALRSLAEKQPDSLPHYRDVMALLGQENRVGRDLAGMTRIKLLMNWWRAIHVPIAVFLVGLLIVHVISVWWY